MALRVQKKLLGMTLKSKESIKSHIDDNTGVLLDKLYDVAYLKLGDKKAAKKVLKDLIKIVVKLGLLYQKGQFNSKELAFGEELRKKFKQCVLTMISYHDVAFTFDQAYLSNILVECKDLLQKLISRHLTDKSKGRVENVFSFYGNGELLANLYNDPAYKELFEQIIKSMEKMVEDRVL